VCLHRKGCSVVSYRYKEEALARKGSGLRLAIKVVKAIDKAGKQAARDAERSKKASASKQAKAEREHQKRLREQERDATRAEKDRTNRAKQAEKMNVARVKQEFKDSLIDAQEEYVERCSERATLRKQFINAVLR
jgi:flagellum-specific peptidoglycan hydrolase FlgJ